MLPRLPGAQQLCSRTTQGVPEYTDWGAAAGSLQGMWAEAWGALDGAANAFSAQLSGLKQEVAEGKKDINTAVDEVGRGPLSKACAVSCFLQLFQLLWQPPRGN